MSARVVRPGPPKRPAAAASHPIPRMEARGVLPARLDVADGRRLHVVVAEAHWPVSAVEGALLAAGILEVGLGLLGRQPVHGGEVLQEFADAVLATGERNVLGLVAERAQGLKPGKALAAGRMVEVPDLVAVQPVASSARLAPVARCAVGRPPDGIPLAGRQEVRERVPPRLPRDRLKGETKVRHDGVMGDRTYKDSGDEATGDSQNAIARCRQSRTTRLAFTWHVTVSGLFCP